MLTLLIVEDDVNVCQKYIEYVDYLDDISIVGITNNAIRALQDIQDYHPHAIILDLELHFGGGSGLDVLQGLNDMSLDIKPYVLVTTNNSSSITYEYARQLGADYILYKHQENYTERDPINLLRTMKSIIRNKVIASSKRQYDSESPAAHTQRLTRRIIAELNLIGISPKAKGYQYLIDAILLTIEKPRTGLPSIIAKMHSKSDISVERAMQNAINKAWRTNNIEVLLRHFTAKISSEKGVPTITEFVCYYATKLKNEY